jgi:hypothetical protein
LPPVGRSLQIALGDFDAVGEGEGGDGLLPWKTTRPTRSRRWYASSNSDRMAALVSRMRSRAPMEPEASTARRMWRPILRSRTLWRRSGSAMARARLPLFAPDLIRSRSPKRRIQGQIRGGRSGGGGPDVAAGLVVAAGAGAAAGRVPHLAAGGEFQRGHGKGVIRRSRDFAPDSFGVAGRRRGLARGRRVRAARRPVPALPEIF